MKTFFRNIQRLLHNIALSLLLAALTCNATKAQFSPDEKTWLEQLNLQGGLPEKLLSTRTVVFYDYTLTEKEILNMQQSLQKTGVDAVAYFELDMLMAGMDVTKAFGDYLNKREVTNLLFVHKSEEVFRIIITAYNGKETVIDKQQPAWSRSNNNFNEALKELYRASSSQRKQNLLINEMPETGLKINPILGNRNEFYAIDLKVDPLAVPKTGDVAIDKELEEIFKMYYPLKYKMTEPGTPEKELRKQGSLYVVCFVRTRGVVAKDLLGYDTSKSESALVSVTYPDNQQQLKNIGSNTPVYKFYFKHIDSGNVFFGTKWDADLTWQQALINQIKGMKAELRLN
ncbi:MAG TPA: hypothetical protein VK589_20240 [Chryseolinea sp.]|nr:hypothetical protein [Chryseolinea sp.]